MKEYLKPTVTFINMQAKENTMDIDIGDGDDFDVNESLGDW